VSKVNLKGSLLLAWRDRLLPLTPYIAGFLIFILLGLPSVLPTYFLSMITKVLIFAIFAISLDLIIGYTGLLSLGHAAFLGVAGYTTGILMVHYDIDSIWLLVPLALLVTAIAAAIIGYISLRVSGVYFLIVTLAFGQLLSVAAVKWRTMTGGTDGLVGITNPSPGRIPVSTIWFFWPLSSAFSFYTESPIPPSGELWWEFVKTNRACKAWAIIPGHINTSSLLLEECLPGCPVY